MTNKIAFFYCVGSTYATADMAKASDLIYTELGLADTAVVKGLRNATRLWGGGPPQDPFPGFLDPEVFDVKKVFYPAAMLGMGASIDTGIANVISLVNALPSGQKWMTGGYSQGAAVMSGVMLETKSGGALASRASTYLGGVTFGNPRRATNYRGEVGGTWSGAFDVPGSTTGGHGSFPTSGPYRRLVSADCDPTKWIDFTHPDDVFSSVGDSIQGLAWTAGNDIFLGTADPLEWLAYITTGVGIATSALATILFAAGEASFTDGAGATRTQGGRGHVLYPYLPPIGNPDGTLSHYQIALKWLESKASAYSVAPVVIPSSSSTVGWSTTLLPPAA